LDGSAARPAFDVTVATTPKIKFCGITTLEDAQAAAATGAWAIGLIFWPGSPRAVSRERAAEIAAAVLAGSVDATNGAPQVSRQRPK
jgi:phosphoribosylanthranilate isomerase